VKYYGETQQNNHHSAYNYYYNVGIHNLYYAKTAYGSREIATRNPENDKG
jgi:hypothetical protein